MVQLSLQRTSHTVGHIGQKIQYKIIIQCFLLYRADSR
jgi:hypothetical protein